MEQQVKDGWVLNNKNVFGLSQDIRLTISCIQHEILNQIETKNISSIEDYLGSKIDVSIDIRFTNSQTIEKLFNDVLGFDTFQKNEEIIVNCRHILSFLQLSLLKEYWKYKHKNILTYSEYQTQYYSLLNSFLASNIDTDQQDFIISEITLCNNLLTELDKPIYNVLSFLNEVLDEPCEFKKNLANSIDKRKKFLAKKEVEKYPKIQALYQFIDYLHSNIENFNHYDKEIEEFDKLLIKRNKLKPENNYKEKQEYKEIQKQLEDIYKTIKKGIENPIKLKATQLRVCKFTNSPVIYFYDIETEIKYLKDNFNENDLSEIFRNKKKYANFRTKSQILKSTLVIFFSELDRVLKILFDFFSENTEENKFKQEQAPQAIQSTPVELLNHYKKTRRFYFKIMLTDFNSKEFYEVLNDLETYEANYKYIYKNLIEIERIEFKNDVIDQLHKLAAFQTRSKFKEIIENTVTRLLQYSIPQQNEKPKPELNKALISLSGTEIIERLHNELKGYFQGKEAELKRALQGEQLQEFLLFPHNQNKFVEVFKRLKYNGFLLSTPKETKDWICSTFTYQYQKGNQNEVREFNTSTVHDILTKDKGEPTKKERICIVNWLPYKSHLTRKREAEKENI